MSFSSVARFGGLRAARRLPRWRSALSRSAHPVPFSSGGTPLIRIDQIYACLGRYSKLKKLEWRLRRHRREDEDPRPSTAEKITTNGIIYVQGGSLRRVFRARGKLVGTSDFVVTRGYVQIRVVGFPWETASLEAVVRRQDGALLLRRERAEARLWVYR